MHTQGVLSAGVVSHLGWVFITDSPLIGRLCFVLQALGLEVRSVLAIGGIGGLAIGLAGREICENLLNGFLLMTTVSVAPDKCCMRDCLFCI